MFRRPTEISSDSSGDSSSSTSTEPEENEPLERVESDPIIEFTATDTLSLSINEDASRGPTELPSDSSYHAHMLMATLLEEHAKTRAVELLNSTTPGAVYSRASPEIQPIAQRMFTQASRVLASNGVLPTAFASDEMQSRRMQYLSGIDNIGLQGLRRSSQDLFDMSIQQSHDGDLVATVSPNLVSQNNQLVLTKAPAVDPPGMMVADMEALHLKPQPFMAMPSPHGDFQLSSESAHTTRSRFRTEFRPIKILGRGGFGEVFAVVNHVDGQQYAVKRIPLKKSSIRAEGGLQDSEKVLREIRTLARLEHCNIVRYFNAWIESPSLSPVMPPPRKLLSDRPALALPPTLNRNRLLPAWETHNHHPFGHSSEPQQPLPNPTMKVNEDAADVSSTSTISLGASDLYTDGRSQISSSVQLPRETESAYVLHLQMSIHPMTLTTFLSPVAQDIQRRIPSAPKRHCFHLIPSLQLLLGILSGLQYLHSMHIVHRDIKPGNILLSEYSGLTGTPPSGFCDVSCSSCQDRAGLYLNPRIADFGLVADVQRPSPASSPSRFRAVGTEFYRPASSLQGKGVPHEAIDESLDVFALGIVLFEMLWSFSTKMERFLLLTDLSQHGRLPAGFAASIDGDYAGRGDMVATCICGMVDKDATRRWSCERLKNFVEEVLHGCQLETAMEALPLRESVA